MNEFDFKWFTCKLGFWEAGYTPPPNISGSIPPVLPWAIWLLETWDSCHVFLFLQGLIPGKNYSYRVQSGSNISEGFEFTAKRDDEVSHFFKLIKLWNKKINKFNLGTYLLVKQKWTI